MSRQDVLVPDIGSDSADVIEILVKPGDAVTAEQSIVVLESAKASMEVPCPLAGSVAEIAVKTGQSVKQGDLLLRVETEGVAVAPATPVQIEFPQPVMADAAPANDVQAEAPAPVVRRGRPRRPRAEATEPAEG